MKRLTLIQFQLPTTLLFIALAGALVGCEEPPAEQPAETPEAESVGADEEHSQEEQHYDHEVELAEFMFEVGHRVAAIWVAGEANNAEMVDYQIHEIEEMVDDIRAAAPEEAGIDIVDYFDTQILPSLQAAEDAIEEGDQQAFITAYDETLVQCNSCHEATGYSFIQVVRPERSPYTNLDFELAE